MHSGRRSGSRNGSGRGWTREIASSGLEGGVVKKLGLLSSLFLSYLFNMYIGTSKTWLLVLLFRYCSKVVLCLCPKSPETLITLRHSQQQKMSTTRDERRSIDTLSVLWFFFKGKKKSYQQVLSPFSLRQKNVNDCEGVCVCCWLVPRKQTI